MKKVQRINESQLRAIVAESVKKVLNEGVYYDGQKVGKMIMDAAKEVEEYGFKDGGYSAWNIGMRLYWDINDMIKRDKQSYEDEINNPHDTDTSEFDDTVWANQELRG